MDAFNSNYKNGEAGYKASETKPAAPGTFLGFFRAVAPSNAQPATAPSNLSGTETASSPLAPGTGYYEPAPVYHGKYEKLCPLTFNTVPVDDATNTKLNRSKLGAYDRAQLFFLLRLERFLRLRHYWLEAMPRTDEEWKTTLVLRGVFSALSDCQKHGVGEDAMTLIKDWGCC